MSVISASKTWLLRQALLQSDRFVFLFFCFFFHRIALQELPARRAIVSRQFVTTQL